MASLEFRGSAYRVTFRLGGKRYQVSTHTRDRREAEACRARVDENLRLVERGRLAVPDGAYVGRFLLSDGKLDSKVSVKRVLTFGELAETYFATAALGAKETSTVLTERIHLDHFLRFVGKRTPVSDITPADVQKYIYARSTTTHRGKTISATTIKKEIATVKFLWNRANRLGHFDGKSPATTVSFPKAQFKEPFRTLGQITAIISRGGLDGPAQKAIWDGLYLKPGEIGDFLTHFKSQSRHLWLYPFCTVAAYTGARRSELIRSRVDDFDFGNRVVLLREKKRSRERETYRTVEMTPLVESTMKEFMTTAHPGGTMTFTDAANVPIERNHCHACFRSATSKSKWSNVRGFHVFRHSFARAVPLGASSHTCAGYRYPGEFGQLHPAFGRPNLLRRH